MSKKNKKTPYIDFEPCNRHCPICGIFIQAGSALHYCDPKTLDIIDRERQIQETTEEDPSKNRDRFQEASPFIETDSFFYNDDDEEVL
jgi:predicted nucleic acid-binding Zn ribbon protein